MSSADNPRPAPLQTIPAKAGISQSYVANNTKIHRYTPVSPTRPFLHRQESLSHGRHRRLNLAALPPVKMRFLLSQEWSTEGRGLLVDLAVVWATIGRGCCFAAFLLLREWSAGDGGFVGGFWQSQFVATAKTFKLTKKTLQNRRGVFV